MPVITVEAGQLDNNKKRALVTGLTKAAADIMKAPEQAFTVLIKENPVENIGFGGVWLPEKIAR
ncbi:MAG: 4-oxalocrotonate tautomerase [Geobacter sp.]|nr:MAG: 4-oxalocrotonate tautomerase [Geobacter sp.]TSK09188.1 MAG: 4-oxalocrotonate tautomerase [Geobacter sp.]